MDDLELTYEHIDWVDIADAELSGDQQAIQQLMYAAGTLISGLCDTLSLFQGPLTRTTQNKLTASCSNASSF